MVDYCEILRLYSLEPANAVLNWEVQSTRDTVADTIEATEATWFVKLLDDDITNEDIHISLHMKKF